MIFWWMSFPVKRPQKCPRNLPIRVNQVFEPVLLNLFIYKFLFSIISTILICFFIFFRYSKKSFFYFFSKSQKSKLWKVNRRVDFVLSRLNSGIFFLIFEPSEWNLNLNIREYRAWKIISNNSKLEPISWELKIENTLFNICVGVWVYKIRQPFHTYQKMRKKIPHLLIPMSSWWAVVQIWSWMKNRPKNGNNVGWNCVGLGKIK